MDRRFSINATNISSPIAESTCLNGSSRRGLFQWGGSPQTSPRKQLHSNMSNNSSTTTTPNGSNSMRISRAQGIKIDPRTFADVQSKGLASRIVKYHDSGSRLNRSMSTGNLRNKPVGISSNQMKRNDVQYKATKQNLSMTRIPPPEQSMFYGNTLSSLLRSNSVISLPKTDDQLSRENRPILHPPPTENDLAPTRSVLEVLKEISRKRINSDDFEHNDLTKRSCTREAIADDVDLVILNSPSTSTAAAATAGLANGLASRFKRQRESGNNSNNNSFTNGSSQSVYNISQQQQQQHHHISPEQAKKRQCNFNNDITSSYSSSKRKLHQEQKNASTTQHNNAGRSPKSSPTDEATQNTRKKMYRPQTQNTQFEQIAKSLSCNTPITPIPATPLTMYGSYAGQDNGCYRPQTSREGGVAIKEARSDMDYYASLKPNATSTSTTSSTKPKLTLFNKDYECDGKVEEEEDSPLLDDECAGISFIKPKKAESVSSIKNPLIEKTKKSKLAMMLCGLRGEVYMGEAEVQEDQTDKGVTTIKANAAAETSDLKFNAPTSTVTTAAATTVVTTSTATITTTTSTTFISSNFTASTATTPTFNLSSGGITGIKPTTATTTDASSTKTTTNNGFSLTSVPAATTTTSATAAAAIPKLGGFQFQSNATSTAVATAATVAPANLPAFSFGITTAATTTAAPTTTTAATTTSNTASTLQFGITTSSNAAVPTSVTTQPKLGGFSLIAAPTTTAAEITAATTTSSVSTFQFGGINSGAGSSLPSFAAATKAISTTTAQATATTTSPPTFNFGSSTTITTSNTAPTFGAIAANSNALGTQQSENVLGGKAAGFTFGASAFGNSNVTTAAAAITTASVVTTTTTSNTTASTNKFSFGAVAKLTTDDAIKSPPPAFGSTLNASKPAFSFGSTLGEAASKTTSTSGFSFGSVAATAPKSNANAPAFGFTAVPNANAAQVGTGNEASSKSSFSFGAATTTAANTITTATTSPPANTTNLFALGGANVAATPIFGSTISKTTAAPLFGTATAPATSTAPIFGATTAQTATSASASPAPLFGAVAKPATTTASATPATSSSSAFSFGSKATNKPSVFGAATTPFTFGGKGADKTEENNTNSAASFTFGGSIAATTTAAPATTTNLFASATTSGSGLVKPSFSFGGSSAASSNNNTTLFGAVSTNNVTNTANSFGSFAAVAAGGTTAVNSNNATQQSNAPFAFGSSNLQPTAINSATSTTAASSPSTGIFGAAAAAKPNTFSFGSAIATSSGTNNATAADSKQKPAFAFGSSGTAPNTAFSFGGGGAATATNQSTNLFSSNAVNSTPASSFNFGAANSAGATPVNTVGSSNPFGPPDQRVIRRATRRLQK